jgi:tetratricopeptide (TPR) repeat protein
MTATEAEVSPASEMLRRRAEEKENVRQAGALTDGERAMQEANALFREGQFLKAAVGYSKAAKADPTNAVIQCNLAYALLKVNKFRQAAAAAGRCVEIDPSSFKGHFRRGLALLPLEDFEAAIDAFVLAVGASPANSPAQREAEQLLNRAKWLCKKHAEGEGKEVPSVAADAVDPDAEKEAMTAKQKMAQKQKMARQMRVKKHTKSMMDKVLADSEGVRELEDTPIGPGQKVASALDPSQIAELSTEDEVLSSKKRLVDGEKMPYDAERVGRFAAAELACVQVSPPPPPPQRICPAGTMHITGKHRRTHCVGPNYYFGARARTYARTHARTYARTHARTYARTHARYHRRRCASLLTGGPGRLRQWPAGHVQAGAVRAPDRDLPARYEFWHAVHAMAHAWRDASKHYHSFQGTAAP